MSIDMSQFYQVFFEESAEHLANMESLLLGLDLDAPDDDQLNAIFRAAHSIKGGSGTFGFSDMTEVTHVLETLLDRIRKHEIAITSAMVDAFLQAGDVLKAMLDVHQNGGVADETIATQVKAKLTRLTSDPISAISPSAQETSKADPSPVSAQHVYRIRFERNEKIFPVAAQLDTLLDDLANLGAITDKQVGDTEVSLTLTAYAGEAELRDIFSFFLEPEQLMMESVGDTEPRAEDADEGYGFFVDPEQAKAEVEDAQGFGFFVEPEQVKAAVEDQQGYGFFTDVAPIPEPTAPVASPSQEPILAPGETPHRRATDRMGPAAETSIRVNIEKVDQMINLVGELVITQAMLAETASRLDPVENESLLNGLAQLERNTRDLQESVMSVRMMPINFVFSRFPRVVRDLASKLSKKVQLRTVGEGTELDKGLIEKISDPLTHLVRNSLDHGIESPEERIAKGKDPQGTITLRAAHQGGNIVIEVVDDGAGLNRERILAKAREKGIPMSESASDAEVWQLIFAPGFSTAAVVTDVSGRGVGMDVVKKNIEGIGGRVELSSMNGQGSTVTIRLPLTLAILDGLSVAVGEQTYIVPLSFISESLQPRREDIREISGQGKVVHVRGEYVPLVALHEVFNIRPRFSDPAAGILVLLEGEGRKVALFVDELLGQHQVVIKSLETNYRRVPGISGATIMGDGRVAMIMDVGAMIKLAQA